MNHKGFYNTTRTADELNQYHRIQRDKHMFGNTRNGLLIKSTGQLPSRSPAGPGAGYTSIIGGGGRMRMIDR